jgi:hypothetical protein
MWWSGFFAGGFAFFGVQNVVRCAVNRGGVVVKVWLETTANSLAKNTPTFLQVFQFFLIRFAFDPLERMHSVFR